LRIFIQVLHIGVGRCAIEVEIIFLDVFAVIALAVGQAKQPLLEDRVFAVPQGEGKAQPLFIVTEPGKPIFAPVIGARASLIVSEVIPRVAVFTVILAHRTPLALAEIGAPLLPWHPLLMHLVQAQLLRRLPAFWAHLASPV
jgi:hypothetical protein